MEPQATAQREYKTPIYTRNANKAYRERQKEKDLDAFNQRNCNYMNKRLEKIKQEGKYEEFKQDKKEYMKIYRQKAKQQQQSTLIVDEIEIIN